MEELEVLAERAKQADAVEARQESVAASHRDGHALGRRSGASNARVQRE